MKYSTDMNALISWGHDKKLAPIKLGIVRINQLITNGEAQGVVLDPISGTAESLDFIVASIPAARIISVSNLPDFDSRLTMSANNIQELALSHTKYPINLELIPNARRLYIKWHKSGFSGVDNSLIENLSVRGYTPKGNEFCEFPQFRKLEKLTVIQSNITNLNQISSLRKISKLKLHYNSKLQSLNGLVLPELDQLTITNSKKLSDYDEIENCSNLRFIKIHDCGPIKSLNIVKKLDKLRSFRFIKTNIVDNDLSLLVKLDDVYFTPRRSYSHKLGDFRHGDADLRREGWDLD